MNRIERLLAERRDSDAEFEIPILRIIALVLLGVALLGMGVLLFYLHSLRTAIFVSILGLLAGWPSFGLGRRHARWAGRNPGGR